jgi:hypothetical protein
MSILKIKNEKGEWQGVTSVKGEKGEPGVSPDITVEKNDRNTYKLRIKTEDRMFTTPNLKGDRAKDVGNTDGELGVIDNWYDWEGHRVTPALTELPALPRLETHPTRYCFDHDVVMYTMDGEPNEKGICSFENYTRHEGSVITVEPNGQDTLADYVIYNARPKYEWDTWEEKQLMKRESRLGFPNMAVKSSDGTCPFEPGDWNWINVHMYDAADIPAVSDVGLLYYGRPEHMIDKGDESLNDGTIDIPEGQQMELDINEPPLNRLISTAPRMKNAIWLTFDKDAEGNCCGEDYQWGISRAIQDVAYHQAALESHPREMGCVLINEGDIYKANDCDGHNMFKDAEGHRGIAVALKPNTNYTIESLNGPVAILASSTAMNAYNGVGECCYAPYVTKVKTDLYETRVETITVSRRQESEIVGADTSSGTGKVPVGQDKVLGTTLMYYIDKDPAYVGRADVPAVCRVPNKVIEKDEYFTFRTGETYTGGFIGNPHYGVFLFCWNEEDYSGIKITEGVEPYSVLDAERIAAGATKMKLNVKFGAEDDESLSDNDVNYYEYNIRLADTTEDNGYVRYLTNECKKSYDLDEFALVGHHHTIEDLDNVEDLNIPVMEVSTVTLSDGISPLEENHFYFVYEGE